MSPPAVTPRASHRVARALSFCLSLLGGCSSPDAVPFPDAAADRAAPDVADDAPAVDVPADFIAADGAPVDVPTSDVPTLDGPATDTALPPQDGPAPADAPPPPDAAVPPDAAPDVARPDVTVPPDASPDVARPDAGPDATPGVDVVRPDAAPDAPVDAACSAPFTVQVTAPTAMQAIETCTRSGTPVYFDFAAAPSGPATSVQFAWRAPDGNLAPPPWAPVAAAPYVARRQVGGTMRDVAPLAVLGLRGTWYVEVTARDACGRTATARQPFSLTYANRDCPNP